MDLRKYQPTKRQIEEFKKSASAYQPFILNDNCQTGVAAKWIYGFEKKLMERDKVSSKSWKQFIEINSKMRKMYDDWIDHISNYVENVTDLSVVDIACNDGYFLFRFLENGVKNALGYDRDGGRSIAINLLNDITGLRVRFINEPYSSMTHTIRGIEEADIVIASAIMLHLSDPLYFLNFLSSITKKILFLFTSIDDNSDFRITYHGKVRKYHDDPFPICFNTNSAVSRPLFEFGVRELGFKKIIELEHQKGWLPEHWYKKYKFFIILKENN